MVRDRVPDITATSNRNLYQTCFCVDQTLHLVINDGLIDNVKITELIRKGKRWLDIER